MDTSQRRLALGVPRSCGTVIVLALLVPGASGCLSFSAGPTMGSGVGARGNATAGGRMGGRLHTSSDGPFFGYEQEIFVNIDEEPCCLPWRVHLLAGYASVPLPDRSPVGFEAAFRGGVGRSPLGTDITTRAELGSQFALPIRVSPRKEPWRGDSLGSAFWAVVPDVNAMWDAPRDVHVSAGLSLRLQLWTPELQ